MVLIKFECGENFTEFDAGPRPRHGQCTLIVFSWHVYVGLLWPLSISPMLNGSPGLQQTVHTKHMVYIFMGILVWWLEYKGWGWGSVCIFHFQYPASIYLAFTIHLSCPHILKLDARFTEKLVELFKGVIKTWSEQNRNRPLLLFALYSSGHVQVAD